ncbi:hypothetical protein FCL47_02930 [Desulfopila sp. IMCC35006]|uniref:murein transglycosylase A n=1 Tax=Desulfopila sp. IMCC35006 TaxID=2569542 RepID=UPI0010AC56A2|nr:MltA domain-containing protein [Desulfopila sp. IMCC35006]TKB28454.1 hypothetical protein FCL47_02930 [Desulfopila sp. IMCC35006]
MPYRLRPLALFAVLLTIVGLSGCSLPSPEDPYKPLHRLTASEAPVFTDDLHIDSLIDSAKRQAAYLKRQNPAQKIVFGSDVYDNRWLLFSVQEFLAKLQQQPDSNELHRFIQEHYLVYQAGGRTESRDRSMLVTGYYEPTFAGSLTKTPPFLTPIYSLPKSLVTLPAPNGKKSIGRYDKDHTFVRFWDRAEIENNALLQGEELAFLQDPFDAFLLHVQGSGRIQLPDKSIRTVRFAGSNGLDYRSIGKLLADEKKMTLEEVNIPAIRAYLHDHPDQRQRILQSNPRFIFFSWGDVLPPRGSSGEPLTPGRSIAIDGAALPGGTLGYLIARRPLVAEDGTITGWVPLKRFVFPQDSGAAIKGTGRVDIFWGADDYAEVAANHMKEQGSLFFLVKKGFPGVTQ